MLSLPLVGGGRLGTHVLGPLLQAGNLGSPNTRDMGQVNSSLFMAGFGLQPFSVSLPVPGEPGTPERSCLVL